MLSFEEFKKRKTQSAQPASEGQQKQSTGSNKFLSFEEWKAQRNNQTQEPEQKTSLFDSSKIDRYIRDANNFLETSNKDLQGMTYQNAGSQYTSKLKQSEDLKNRGFEISQYLNQYRDELDDKYVNSVKNAIKEIDGASKQAMANFLDSKQYYSQWESEDDYNAYLAQLQDYEDKSRYDIEAGQKEIEALEEQLKQLTQAKSNSSSVNGMPYAIGQQAVYSEEYAPAANNVNGMPYAAYQQAMYAPVDKQASELRDEILRKKQYLNQAKQIQRKIAFESAAGNKDFAKQSAYIASDDEQYTWINHEQFRSQYSKSESDVWNTLNSAPNPNAQKSKYERKSYDLMTDDEIKLYNYYYATQGAEKAQEYLDVIQEELNRRAGEQIAGEFKDQTAAEIFYGAAAGLSQFGSGVKGAVSMITGKDDYLPQSKQQFAGQYMREDLADNGVQLPTWMGGGSLAQGAYDLVSTTANMAPSILASAVLSPVAGSALMGTSAAGNAYQTALNSGYDKNAARAYGVAIGVAETAMQSLLGGISSLGGVSPAVTKAVEGIDNGLLRFFAKYGASMASEGLEEGLQEVLDPILQNAILGADENVDWANVVYSALLGAASAGVLEIGGSLSEARQESAAKAEYGNKTDELLAEGLSYDAGTEANEIAQQYKARVDSGKSMTGAQIKHQLEANDVAKVETAAKERLVELGETDNPAEIAKLATKRALGEALKHAEKSRLARSKFGAQVAKELAPENAAKGKLVDAMTRPGKYKPLDTRVETDVSGRVSESGKNELADSGAEFDLKQIDAKTGNDGKLVWTVDGQEATSENIKFKDEDTAYIFEAVEQIENITPTAAPVLARSVDTRKDITKQLNGLDEAYTYGYNGYTEADMNAGEFTSDLTDTQKMDAFRLGEAARKSRTETRAQSIKKMRTAAEAEAAQGKSTQLKITYDHGNGNVEDFRSNKVKGLTGKQKAAVEVAEMLHKLGIGTDIEFFSTYLSKTLKDPKTGKAARVFLDENGNEVAAYAGVYMGAGGKIRIDLNAYNGRRLALNAMSHELVHFVQDWSPEKYQAMAEFLASAYGETELSMHQRVLREQERLQRTRNQDVPYAEAYDEVVANALNKMFDDGTIMTKLAELRNKDAALADKIIEGIRIIADRLLKVFNQNQYLYHDTLDLMQMGDTFKQIQDMFAEALVDASDNLQAARIAQEAFGNDANIETNENGELLLATNENKSVVMYSEQTYLNGGRDKLETALRQNGHTESEITETLSYVDDALDYIKVLAAGYAKQMGYTNLSNHLIADVITNVKTGKQVMSSIVNNGDYPVNIDLSLICKKRVAYMNLMSRLIRDGVFDKVNYDGAAIAEVNDILRENGFETACLGCFVESRRLQFQTWAETIVSEWNAEVEKRNPNADNFGFAKGDMQSLTDADINELTRELESVKKNDQGNVNLGQGNSVTRMGRLLDALPSLQKKLTVEDLLTPEGLTALRQHDGSLFSIVKSRYGAASPKIVQDFNPYASEIAMLSFAQVKNITSNAVKGAQTYVNEVKNEYGKIVRAKGESKENFNKRKKMHEQRIQDEAMRRYLYDIGGARIQSFSDFMIENVFDYIQIFADLAAKRLPLHGYTKEIVCMRLFGMTGAKWNGSLIAHVERDMGKELAGLLPAGTKDGIPVKVDGKDYVIGFDDYARNAATKGKSFIQSIGMKDIIALQLDPRYSPYVGNITIGVSDAQIMAMLDSPLFRMVIPYHASGMLPMFAKLVGVDMYNDYTDYQNTTVRQYYDLNGNAVSELQNAKGDAVKADTSYAFNAEIQKTKDAKTAANNYLKWCAQRHPVYDGKTLVGYATFNPKFSSSPYGTDFTRHENYYKLLEDFNTYDSVTEESAVQGAVTMNFPSEENRLTEQQMAEYKKALRETGVFTEQDIEKYSKKADMTFKEIINAEVGNRANYAATQAPKWEATVKEVEAKLQRDYARKQYSSQETDLDKKRITIGMTDSERTDILQTKVITAEVYDNQADEAVKRESASLESGQLGLIKSALTRIADEFDVFTGYDIKDVEVKVEFSISNLHESVSKKITPEVVAKLMPVLKTAVENAVGIESHTNRYFYDTDIVRFDNLVGGYVDGESFVPVRFGLKHRRNGEVILYVIVDQQKVPINKIKAEVVKIAGTQKVQPEVSRSAFKMSIPDIVPFVNGGDLLRYLPDDMLTENQKQIKWDAIADTIVRTNEKNDAKYAKYIREGKIRAVTQMVEAAAKEAGYTIKAWHGSRHIFDRFSKDTLGSNTRTKASYRWFFAGDKETANSYYPYGTMRELARQNPKIWKESDAEKMKHKGKLYELYLKMENPLIVDVAGYDYAAHAESADSFMEYIEQAERNGNDGIILYHVRDNQLRPSAEESTVYMFKEPSQAKSADPITYDEQDNVVPISERFNEKKDELRYSTQETDPISNRHLLANAFEGISRSSVEYGMIQDYKRNIDKLNKLEEQLSDVNAEIRQLRFGKDVERDPERLKALEEKAAGLAKEINKYDKRLINMEASEPLRKVLDRERKKVRQKTIEHTKQIQQNRKLRKEQTELRKRIRRTIMDLDKILNKGDKKRNVKEGMRDFASKALASAEALFTDNYSEDDMIRNGVSVTMEKWENDLMKETKNLFDQIDLIYKNAETTEEVNRIIAGDTQSYEARMETLNKLDQKIAENKRKLKGVFARERVRLNETTISSVLNELASEYRKLGSSDDLYIRGATNEDVYQHLLSLSEEVGGTVVNDMTLNQLEAVYNAYKMVLTTVRKANQMFNKEIKESVHQMGSAVIGEVQSSGGVHGEWSPLELKANEASWNNTKPIWVANRIQSGTFEKLMHGLFKGQYQYAVDVDEAKKYKQMADKKFKPRKWDTEKLHTFTTPNGNEFQLNLQQIMSLYAYSKREQSYSHLLNGGFVFSNQTKVVSDKGRVKKTFLLDSAKAYKLDQNVLSEIIGTLSDEQKAYVDSMQAYLSETMGEKGNEVSVEMLGVKLFKEKFYFPLRSSGAYLERAKEAELKKQQGQINIASSGFTHSVKPEAKNPVVLDGFLDVWAEHCVEMSMYHSMVLPMEDFRRVYNYKTIADTEVDARSVFQTIQDAYGSAATNYIDQLYRELNAGATIDPRETSAKARISKFKKSAVMLSSSVVVQQFSSIGRAFDVIDPKFFAGEKVKSTKMKAADEMKKYAPVAVIKEIGGFDTGIKGSAKTYIMAESYDKGERVKGFMSDEQYRGDITGFAPAKADEITWTAIWEAAKRETHARNPKMDVESEAFLEQAGNRFSEAIEKTQVYDSVLARSANMRSKSALMSMATAFIAEPTTTINLLEDAIRSKKAKNIARAFGSVAASILLNNALASVVYAMRDDDEDETFVEKYFQSFVSGMIDDINPMSYYPYLKDVYSLFQGYDVERADMSVITDLRDAVKKAVPLMGKDVAEMSDEELSAHWKNVNSVIMSILDAGFAMFGVSEKNVRRDAASIINTYKTIRKDIAERDTTWMSFWDKVGAAAKDTIPVYAWTKDKTKTDVLYETIMAGDVTYLNRLKNGYKDENAYTTAVRKALRENDDRIQEAAKALYENNAAEYKRLYQQIRSENKFSADDILSAIDSEAAALKKETDGTSESAPYSASDFVKATIAGDAAAAKSMKDEYISFKVSSGMSKNDATKKFQQSVQDSVNDAFSNNMLTRNTAKKMLIEHCGKSADEAEDRITYWEFKKKYPQYNLSDDAVWDYYDIAEPLGIGLRDYVNFIEGKKTIETKRDENGTVIESSRDQTVALIHSLNLTDDQKDALYILEGYSKNKLGDTPWH